MNFRKNKILLIKGERGTHMGLVRVRRDGKIFTRKQRVGKKDKLKIPTKSSLDLDNLVEIKSIYEDTDIKPGIHAGDSFICKFKDGSSGIHKVMRKIDIHGEVGAYRTSEILGWNIVPETIKVDYGKGFGSSQKWIPNGREFYDPIDENDEQVKIEDKYFDGLAKIFVLDMITGNNDRHNANMIIDQNDKIWAIDNENWGSKPTKENMTNLKSVVSNDNVKHESIMQVLDNSFGGDKNKYSKFQKLVYDNLVHVVEKQDELTKCWEKSINGDNFNTTQQSLNRVIRNLEYIKAYYEAY